MKSLKGAMRILVALVMSGTWLKILLDDVMIFCKHCHVVFSGSLKGTTMSFLAQIYEIPKLN
jgi:hypothetical protein